MSDGVIHNRVKELLQQGKVVVGIRSFINDPALFEIIGWTGFDFASMDTQHAPADVGETLSFVRACELTGLTPIVRVYENHPSLICKALDNGAQGVIVPNISTVSQAEAAVRSVKYPPLGDRSVCPLVRSSRFGLLASREYYQKVNDGILLILIIEGREGFKNLPDILKVKGVDIISFGPVDYSHSVGLPGETYEDPQLYAALKATVKMCGEFGVPVMTVIPKSASSEDSNLSMAKKIADAGVRLIHLDTDLGIFREACKRLIKIRAVL